jgi:hypothetical protein
MILIQDYDPSWPHATHKFLVKFELLHHIVLDLES